MKEQLIQGLEFTETANAYDYAIRHKIPFDYVCSDDIKRFDWDFLTYGAEVDGAHELAVHQFITQAYQTFPSGAVEEEALNISWKLDEWKSNCGDCYPMETEGDKADLRKEMLSLSMEDVADYAASRFLDHRVNTDVHGMEPGFVQMMHANAIYWLRVATIADAAIMLEDQRKNFAA